MKRIIIIIRFPTYKMHFFFFLLFGPLILSNLLIFQFFIHFKQFKVLQEHHLKFFKSSSNSNSNKARKMFLVFRNRHLQCLVVCFNEFLTPFILVGCNFLISYLFFQIVSVSDAPRGGVQVLFRHQKYRALPLDPACPERLSVRSPAGLPRVHTPPLLSFPLEFVWVVVGSLNSFLFCLLTGTSSFSSSSLSSKHAVCDHFFAGQLFSNYFVIHAPASRRSGRTSQTNYLLDTRSFVSHWQPPTPPPHTERPSPQKQKFLQVHYKL